MQLTPIDIIAAEKELCRRSLAYFIKRAWRHVVPDKLQWNWHIEAIAQHLEAVHRGEITRLLVNIPPGTSKSTIVGVMYPAWLWGPGGQPWHRFIGAAHEQGLAVRDNRIMRNLITSEWYQSLWPIAMAVDQNEKLYFENDKRGFRQACAVASMTGRRGHCLSGDTLIATTSGEKTMYDIAISAESCNVYSYDIHSKRLVERPVQAVARGSSRHINRVHFTSGRVVTCSRDHKFYTSRGYVEARFLSKGDTCVQLLRQSVCKDCCGCKKIPCKNGGSDILQSVMLNNRNEHSCGERGSILHGMRQKNQEGGRPELFGRVQVGVTQVGGVESSSREKNNFLRDMPKINDCPYNIQAKVLLCGMLIDTPQVSHFWGEQPCVAGRGGRPETALCWFPTGMDQNTDENCGSRPWEVRGLCISEKASRSPHRREQHQQHPIQSSHTLCEMPFCVARRGKVEASEDIVAMVENVCGESDTYDLQVNGTNCFFANGILVHNSIVWDDPLSPEKAMSDLHRETAIRILSETVPTRLNDPDKSAIIVVMQRLHEGDPSGHILTKDLGYDHLCIPMEFETDRRSHTSIGWTDPRTIEGELLDAVRFPASVIDRDKKAMGSYAWAGQMQQRPAPRGGGMFKRSDFRVVQAEPAGYRWVRGWDLAATDDPSAARTAGVKLGIGPDKRICIAHVVKDRVNAAGVERLLGSTAAADGEDVRGSIPQDPGSAGKSWALHLLKHALMGYSYTASPETGDKETRAMPLAAQVEAGNVDIVVGDWNGDFLDEAATFPMGKFKDQIDAATRAFDMIVAPRASAGIFLRKKNR